MTHNPTVRALNFPHIKNLLIKKYAIYKVKIKTPAYTIILLPGIFFVSFAAAFIIHSPGYAVFTITPANGKTSAIIMLTNKTINVTIITYAKTKLTKTEYTESLSK